MAARDRASATRACAMRRSVFASSASLIRRSSVGSRQTVHQCARSCEDDETPRRRRLVERLRDGEFRRRRVSLEDFAAREQNYERDREGWRRDPLTIGFRFSSSHSLQHGAKARERKGQKQRLRRQREPRVAAKQRRRRRHDIGPPEPWRQIASWAGISRWIAASSGMLSTGVAAPESKYRMV